MHPAYNVAFVYHNNMNITFRKDVFGFFLLKIIGTTCTYSISPDVLRGRAGFFFPTDTQGVGRCGLAIICPFHRGCFAFVKFVTVQGYAATLAYAFLPFSLFPSSFSYL